MFANSSPVCVSHGLTYRERDMKRSFLPEAVGFVLHFALATIGAVLIGFVVSIFVFIVDKTTGLSMVGGGLGAAYDPWFWIPAGLGGYFVNRITRSHSACLVAVMALTLLFGVMSWDVSSNRRNPYHSQLINDHYRGRYWQYEFEQLLSPSDVACGPSECLGKVLFTLPVVTAVAYSVGAWIGLRSKVSEVS
jgi:hypothetical protein